MKWFLRAGMAVLIGAGIGCAAARAQDCASPDETEALAVSALLTHLLVARLQCRDANAFNLVVRRFGEDFLYAQRRASGHLSGEHARTSFDRWNTTLVNEWAEQAMRQGAAMCTEAGSLFQELADTERGAAFNAVATRIATRVPAWVPTTCDAAQRSAAPPRP